MAAGTQLLFLYMRRIANICGSLLEVLREHKGSGAVLCWLPAPVKYKHTLGDPLPI